MKQKIFKVIFIIVVCAMLILPNQSLAVATSERTNIDSIEKEIKNYIISSY